MAAGDTQRDNTAAEMASAEVWLVRCCSACGLRSPCGFEGPIMHACLLAARRRASSGLSVPAQTRIMLLAPKVHLRTHVGAFTTQQVPPDPLLVPNGVCQSTHRRCAFTACAVHGPFDDTGDPWTKRRDACGRRRSRGVARLSKRDVGVLRAKSACIRKGHGNETVTLKSGVGWCWAAMGFALGAHTPGTHFR